MKAFSILSENYIQGIKLISNSQNEIVNTLNENKELLNTLLENLFANEDISTESSEFFEFRSNKVIRDLLREDFSRELTEIIFESRKENCIDLDKAVKCAHVVGEIEKPTENDHSEYDKVNNLFGFNSEVNDEGLKLIQTTTDIPTFHNKVKEINDVQEEAKKQINEAMSNIGKYDKDVLSENFNKLMLVKTFIDCYK